MPQHIIRSTDCGVLSSGHIGVLTPNGLRDMKNQYYIVSNNSLVLSAQTVEGLNQAIPAYNGNTILSDVGVSMESNIKMKNIEKLNLIANFEENWNGYNAPKFDSALIDKAKEFIQQISFQPEVFPIPGGAIQFEYNKDNGEYLELEISLDTIVSVFQIKESGEEREYEIKSYIHEINKIVEEFYGSRIYS